MLANCTIGLIAEFFISCFISGLGEDLKHNVHIFCPISMSTIIGLTYLQEEKKIIQHRMPKPPFTWPTVFIATMP